MKRLPDRIEMHFDGSDCELYGADIHVSSIPLSRSRVALKDSRLGVMILLRRKWWSWSYVVEGPDGASVGTTRARVVGGAIHMIGQHGRPVATIRTYPLR